MNNNSENFRRQDCC